MTKILELLHEMLNSTGELYDYPISDDTWIRVIYLDLGQYAYACQSRIDPGTFLLGNLEQVSTYISDHAV
jgi:hypothetical protein